MRSLPVVLRAAAERDIRRAHAHYEGRREGLGADFLRQVDAALETVAGNPELCQVVEQKRQIRRALTRRFPYALYYLTEPERVVVLAVLPASMNPTRWHTRR
ncbi:MAG: type II toxin-antitoxin system RelE/ParE family toxin [Myxococcota bacterium]